MPITRIQITNLGAIQSFDAPDLPLVVLVQGGNGAGKTSFQDAIMYLVASGHDPDMIHGNAESGEIIVTFSDSDGGPGHQAMAKVTRKNTVRGWRPADGTKKWNWDRKLIDAICDATAYDPMGFLKLKEADQVARLLELAPIEVAAEEIQSAVGSASPEVGALQLKSDMNGLEIIDATYECLYAARTPLNTGAATQEAHASELESALAPAAPGGTDWATEVGRIQESKRALETAQAGEIADLRSEFNATEAAKKDDCAKACAAIDEEIQAKIDALKAEQTTRRNAEVAKMTGAVEHARGIATQEAARIRGEYGPRIEAVTVELATAQERDRSHQQAEGTRKAIAVARKEADVKRARSQAITEALDRLKTLKLTAAGRLKIPGVQVQAGRIVREEDGAWIPFKRWNQASQMTFCLRLALMANAKAGFVLVDDCEHFEPEKFAALVKTAERYAQADGVQFIIASVAAGPLVVKGA